MEVRGCFIPRFFKKFFKINSLKINSLISHATIFSSSGDNFQDLRRQFRDSPGDNFRFSPAFSTISGISGRFRAQATIFLDNIRFHSNLDTFLHLSEDENRSPRTAEPSPEPGQNFFSKKTFFCNNCTKRTESNAFLQLIAEKTREKHEKTPQKDEKGIF